MNRGGVAWVCRVPALLLLLAGAVLALLGVVLLPPVLARILAAGATEPGIETIGSSVAGLALVAFALWVLRAARRSFRAAGERSARRAGFRLVTVVLAALVALALLEVAARAGMTPEDVLWGDALHHWLWAEGRRRPSAAERLSQAYPTDRYDPRLGWVPAANYRSERLNVNADGLRGLREHPRDKPPGERRIVVAGDSFTWGEDVADEEVYTEVLDELLEDVRVINLGVHGYGTDQQVLRLKQIGFDYDPDLVILSYYKPNAERNLLSFRSYAKPRFRLSGGGLRLENVPVPDPSDPRMTEYDPLIPSYVWALLKKSVAKGLSRTRFAPEWELTRAILDSAVAETRARGVAFLLVYIPAMRPHLSRAPEAAEAVLADWAAARGVPFVDLRREFLELPPERRERLYRGHWTPEGHRVAAALIAERIAAGGLL